MSLLAACVRVRRAVVAAYPAALQGMLVRPRPVRCAAEQRASHLYWPVYRAQTQCTIVRFLWQEWQEECFGVVRLALPPQVRHHGPNFNHLVRALPQQLFPEYHAADSSKAPVPGHSPAVLVYSR